MSVPREAQIKKLKLQIYQDALEKEMASHSSVLAWRTPGTGEPGGLPSLGLHRVGHDSRDLAAAAAYRVGTKPGVSDFLTRF